MRDAAVRLAMVLAACWPAAVGAQPFGAPPHHWRADPVRGPDPVNVEIAEQGRTIWQGQLQTGFAPNGSFELLAQPPGLIACFSREVGPIVSGEDLDRLALTVQWNPTPFVKDRYTVRLERQRVVPVTPVPGEYGMECRPERHHREELTVTAEARLPPGERVRIDGAGGLEIFLTRPPEAVTPDPAPGRESVPTIMRADFDVSIERGGASVWEGTFHQEIYSDRGVARGGSSLPRAMRCPARSPIPHCAAWIRSSWELSVQARNEREVEVVFSAGRYDPDFMVPLYGAITDRGRGGAMELNSTLALAPGETGLVRALDYVIRVRRR